MALRTRAKIVLDTASKSESVISGEGGLRGLMHRVRERFATGKLLRPDVEDDPLRKPVSESGFRFPSPGSQKEVIIPRGSYQGVFDITYHSRDARRRVKREEVNVEDARSAGLPPTAGRPAKTKFLGMLGDFDRKE